MKNKKCGKCVQSIDFYFEFIFIGLMDLEKPFVANTPADAAIIKMAIETLGVPYTTQEHRSFNGRCEIVFYVTSPIDPNNEKIKQAIIDVELDIELGIDPVHRTKFEMFKGGFSSAFPFKGV
jgi:hypothetical protein